jgi:hypothetical protein
MPRVGSLAAFLRVRAGCFSLLLGMATAVLLPGDGAAETSWIQVLRDDDRGLELLLQAPEPERVGNSVRVTVYLPNLWWQTRLRVCYL